MSGLEGWVDLPEGLLHSIVARLGSFYDLLAFAATCPSWRVSFSSYPSKSTLLPPLLLQPDVLVCSPCSRPFSNNLIPKRSCYVTDLANQSTYMCCQVPQFAGFCDRKSPPSYLDGYSFGAVSYGQLILYDQQRSCLVVDVFTGATVSAPQLPVDGYVHLYYAALTAPLSSPNSHLLVNAGCHNFFWHVGSHSWLRRSPRNGMIKQIVVFKGQVFGMDHDRRLYVVHLVPQIRIQKIVVDLDRSRASKWHLSRPWLVTCGDMLLMVGSQRSSPSTGDAFEAFRLDLSTEPAKWVKVEKLENWAIFISIDQRSQALCCMNPERWGGRSNCIYCYDSKKWIEFELNQPLQEDAFIFITYGSMMQPMWVVPSMFYSCP
uniref:Uncharacterized protein n=1 Tax=Avena sativa TaxID=4498 RepID=A0ACD6A496_AVESA